MTTKLERLPQLALVEDHPATRAEMRRILSDFASRAELVDVFVDAESFLASGVEARIDVVLMDLGLPGMSGTEAIRALGATSPAVRAVALTAFDDERNLFEALRAGAHGYVLKDEPAERIVQAVEDAAAGAHPISSRVAGFLVLHARETEESVALSAREDQLAGLLARGSTYADCAATMDVTVGTVQDYVKRLYRKLDVHSRAEVRAWVQRRARRS